MIYSFSLAKSSSSNESGPLLTTCSSTFSASFEASFFSGSTSRSLGDLKKIEIKKVNRIQVGENSFFFSISNTENGNFFWAYVPCFVSGFWISFHHSLSFSFFFLCRSHGLCLCHHDPCPVLPLYVRLYPF